MLREFYHDQTSQESLADYIARPPISLKKIRNERLSENEEEVDVDARKRARARLLAKVYVPTLIAVDGPDIGLRTSVVAAFSCNLALDRPFRACASR